jgi:cystathionine beta-lyase/cystathionine gamma-synthase
MNFETQVVHLGDRKRTNGTAVPSTTPIHLSTTYFHDSIHRLDRIFGHEEEGLSYSRYGNPTNAALEELVTGLENGYGAHATASGMAALQIAVQAALLDRNHSVLTASAIYGTTIKMLDHVFAPFGVEISFVDICDLAAFAKALDASKPGCVLIESLSNPLLRVGRIDKISELAHAAGAAVVVDSTFATPMLLRPLDLGANIVVHSMTKYLAGHGDVLGGIVVSDEQHMETIRTLSQLVGANLGPFESYLTMRGVKTLAVRFERQCQNAKVLAERLAAHRCIERVHYCGDPKHPDACAIKQQFAPGLFVAILAFEIRGANKESIMAFMDRLKLIVPGTSLGDVHSLMLYPHISSHREVSPKMRERMGIRENLVRLAVGIESAEDIYGDLDQALRSA